MTGGDWESFHAQRVKEERMRREAGFGPSEPMPEERDDDVTEGDITTE
jgi:hypothetical protein